MSVRTLIIPIAFLWLSCCNNETRIGIQPFDHFDAALTDTIAHTLAEVYHADTYVLPQKVMPTEAFVNIKTPRYRADKILRILNEERADSLTYVLALTTHDISTTKKDANGHVKKPEEKYSDWGVFGLGHRPGPCCIVSVFRLKTTNPVTLRERVKKICVHEIGHNLGLTHCTFSKKCVMQDAAESIQTIDHAGLTLCDRCRSQIHLN